MVKHLFFPAKTTTEKIRSKMLFKKTHSVYHVLLTKIDKFNIKLE